MVRMGSPVRFRPGLHTQADQRKRWLNGRLYPQGAVPPARLPAARHRLTDASRRHNPQPPATPGQPATHPTPAHPPLKGYRSSTLATHRLTDRPSGHPLASVSGAHLVDRGPNFSGAAPGCPRRVQSRRVGNPAAGPVVTYLSSVLLMLGCCLPGQAGSPCMPPLSTGSSPSPVPTRPATRPRNRGRAGDRG